MNENISTRVCVHCAVRWEMRAAWVACADRDVGGAMRVAGLFGLFYDYPSHTRARGVAWAIERLVLNIQNVFFRSRARLVRVEVVSCGVHA